MMKLGIIGWGYWGRNYAKYFDSGLDAQLSMVCDLRQEMLNDAKRLYPHFVVTKNFQDLIDARLDGVIIASPASAHEKIATPFLKAGIPLLIEKPLTDSLKSATRLAQLAKQIKTKVLVGHTFLYNQSVRYLKKAVDAGELGKLYYLEFRRQSYGPIRDDVNIVWDFASHDIAISNYLLGALPESSAVHMGKFSRNSQEDVAVIVLRYPGNVMVNINVAWLYPVKIRTLTVLGDKKMAVFEDINAVEPVKVFDTSVQYPQEDDPARASFRLGDILIPRIQPIDPLGTELRHFVEYIKGKEKPLTPIEDGVAVVSVLESLTKNPA